MIWTLERHNRIQYDEYMSLAVVASSVDEARQVAYNYCMAHQLGNTKVAVANQFLDPTKSSCQRVNTRRAAHVFHAHIENG